MTHVDDPEPDGPEPRNRAQVVFSRPPAPRALAVVLRRVPLLRWDPLGGHVLHRWSGGSGGRTWCEEDKELRGAPLHARLRLGRRSVVPHLEDHGERHLCGSRQVSTMRRWRQRVENSAPCVRRLRWDCESVS